MREGPGIAYDPSGATPRATHDYSSVCVGFTASEWRSSFDTAEITTSGSGSLFSRVKYAREMPQGGAAAPNSLFPAIMCNVAQSRLFARVYQDCNVAKPLVDKGAQRTQYSRR